MGPLDGSLSLDLHHVTARVFLEVLKGFPQLDLGSLFHLLFVADPLNLFQIGCEVSLCFHLMICGV